LALGYAEENNLGGSNVRLEFIRNTSHKKRIILEIHNGFISTYLAKKPCTIATAFQYLSDRIVIDAKVDKKGNLIIFIGKNILRTFMHNS